MQTQGANGESGTESPEFDQILYSNSLFGNSQIKQIIAF